MLAELGSCLLLAVALLGPGPKAHATKGRGSRGQAGSGRAWRGGQVTAGVSGGFHVGGQKAGGLFGGELAELRMYLLEMVKDSICGVPATRWMLYKHDCISSSQQTSRWV